MSQLTLCDPGAEDVKPSNLQQMYLQYGDYPGRTCGECAHLFDPGHGNGRKRYYKCGLSAVTRGPGTDWRKSWQACGRFVDNVV